jgi:exopolysaccharide biosynthesis protein
VALSSVDRTLWLVVVDGRQGAYSTGMTLPELTGLLEALGADEAVNLDGGGSSVLVVRGRAVSRPSDETGERPVVNALLLVDDPSLCGPLSGPGSP